MKKRRPEGLDTGEAGAGPGKKLLAAGVLKHERLQDGGNLLLLATWQPRSSIEELPHFSGRAIATFAGCTFAEQLLDVHTKRRRQLLQLVWTQGNRVALPVRIRPLRHAQAFSQCLLRESDLFAHRMQSCAERRPLFGGRSAGLHARSIRGGFQG